MPPDKTSKKVSVKITAPASKKSEANNHQLKDSFPDTIAPALEQEVKRRLHQKKTEVKSYLDLKTPTLTRTALQLSNLYNRQYPSSESTPGLEGGQTSEESGTADDWSRNLNRLRSPARIQATLNSAFQRFENLKETFEEDPDFQDMMSLVGAASGKGGTGVLGGAVRSRIVGRFGLGALASKANMLMTGVSVGLRLRGRMQAGSNRAFFMALVLALIKDLVDLASLVAAGIPGTAINLVITPALYMIVIGQKNIMGRIIKFALKKVWKYIALSAVGELIPIFNVFPAWTITILLIKRQIDKKLKAETQEMSVLIKELQDLSETFAAADASVEQAQEET